MHCFHASKAAFLNFLVFMRCRFFPKINFPWQNSRSHWQIIETGCWILKNLFEKEILVKGADFVSSSVNQVLSQNGQQIKKVLSIVSVCQVNNTNTIVILEIYQYNKYFTLHTIQYCQYLYYNTLTPCIFISLPCFVYLSALLCLCVSQGVLTHTAVKSDFLSLCILCVWMRKSENYMSACTAGDQNLEGEKSY